MTTKTQTATDKAEYIREYHRNWRKANPEKVAAYRLRYKDSSSAYIRKWKADNPERVREHSRKHAELHPESRPARQKKWMQANPEKSRARCQARKARKANADGKHYTTAENIIARWAVYDNKCWMCGAKALCTDHVKPLSKGGAHYPANLRPSCTSCNCKKASKWPFPTTIKAWAVGQ
jgi:hypothetical protein